MTTFTNYILTLLIIAAAALIITAITAGPEKLGIIFRSSRRSKAQTKRNHPRSPQPVNEGIGAKKHSIPTGPMGGVKKAPVYSAKSAPSGDVWDIEYLNKDGTYMLKSVKFCADECKDSSFLLGRGDKAKVRFNQSSISEQHAQIIYDSPSASLVLIDDGWSKNGTYTGSSYNTETDEYTPGKKINNVTITDGLVVWLADVPIRFKKA